MSPEVNQRSDGFNYAPQAVGPTRRVVEPGEFVFASAHLDHNHIYGMTNGLVEAGATLRYVYDPNPKAVAEYAAKYPGVTPVDSLDAILADPEVKMVSCAAIDNQRGGIGLRVMRAGKDYFADKPLFTTMAQIDDARRVVAETGRKYMGYFSERLHVECAVRAGELVKAGRIGRVVQVLGLGPHRINAPSRPDWFFDLEQSGGILCDIGSHQIEQFLYFTGAQDAQVTSSRVGTYRYKEYAGRGFYDFGDMNLLADNGAVGYFRVDWLTPDALETWGDGRTIILGTDGYIELRKYTDLGGTREQDNLFLVTQHDNERHSLYGKVGFPFFGEMILDCLNRTENAMTQSHVFKTSELAVQAQQNAVVVEK